LSIGLVCCGTITLTNDYVVVVVAGHLVIVEKSEDPSDGRISEDQNLSFTEDKNSIF